MDRNKLSRHNGLNLTENGPNFPNELQWTKGDQNELKCYADVAQYERSSYKYYVLVFGYYVDGF